MIRRLASGAALTTALFAASIGWAGLTMQRTVFDKTRTQRIADALLTNTAVRDSLVAAIVGTVDKGLPEALRAQVPTNQLATAARTALASPTVRADIEKALVDTHAYVLGDTKDRPVLQTKELDTAVRQGLLQVRPDLAPIIDQLPPVVVTLPSAGLPGARLARGVVDLVTFWAAAVAAALIVAVLAVSPDRGWALRRIGRWAIGAGALWVGLRFAVPILARKVIPGSAALVSGLATAAAESMTVPGLALLTVGVLSLALGSVLGRLRQRRRKALDRPRSTAYADLARRRGTTDEAPPASAGKVAKAARAEAKAARTAATAAPSGAPAAPVRRAASATGGEQAEEAFDIPLVSIVPTLTNNPPTKQPRTAASAAPIIAPIVAPVAPTVSSVAPVAPPQNTPLVAARSAGAETATAPDAPASQRNGKVNAEAAAKGPAGPGENRFAGAWLGGFQLDPRQHPRIADPPPPPPRWVEGVGYVFEYPPFEGVRWVEGLGYVVTEADMSRVSEIG